MAEKSSKETKSNEFSDHINSDKSGLNTQMSESSDSDIKSNELNKEKSSKLDTSAAASLSELNGLSAATKISDLTGLSTATKLSDLAGLAAATKVSDWAGLSAVNKLSELGGLSAAMKVSDLAGLSTATKFSDLVGLSAATKVSDWAGLSAVNKLSELGDLSAAMKVTEQSIASKLSEIANAAALNFPNISVKSAVGVNPSNSSHNDIFKANIGMNFPTDDLSPRYKFDPLTGQVTPYAHKAKGGGIAENLREQIDQLRDELNVKADQLSKALKETKTTQEELLVIKEEAKIKEDELLKKSMVAHILPRICESAQEKLMHSDLSKHFIDGNNIDCVVVSIDIRRSTELMLKARTPQRYADFIVSLSANLKEAILENFGVFDKFTGDGILAFFPTFFSGEDAMYYALKASNRCHSIFRDTYLNSRSTFNVFIQDVGLGIGIDYGSVSLVNSASDLTVVGIPVVYACRMSGAPSGKTYLNQPAFEKVVERYGNHTKFLESKIEIKHEGVALAYEVEINENSIENLTLPSWFDSTQFDMSAT